MKEIVLDTETTGLEIKDGHRIVEIGCIELENQIPTSKKFHYYLNPERKVSEKAFKVHGYTDEFLVLQKKFVEIYDEFLEFIKIKKDIESKLSLIDSAQTVNAGTTSNLDELDNIALGRVWSGKKAKDLGLVDINGNLHDAIEIAKMKSLMTYEDMQDFSCPQYNPFQ